MSNIHTNFLASLPNLPSPLASSLHLFYSIAGEFRIFLSLSLLQDEVTQRPCVLIQVSLTIYIRITLKI